MDATKLNVSDRWQARAGLLLLFVILLLGSGCGTFYSTDWKRAGRKIPNEGVAGRWEGTWLSDVNGHTGKLRCIVTHGEGDTYQFYYWATFWKMFSGTYEVDFTVHGTNGVYSFEGHKNLGELVGGVYYHQGTATTNELHATYSCDIDHGRFDMKRPE